MALGYLFSLGYYFSRRATFSFIIFRAYLVGSSTGAGSPLSLSLMGESRLALAVFLLKYFLTPLALVGPD